MYGAGEVAKRYIMIHWPRETLVLLYASETKLNTNDTHLPTRPHLLIIFKQSHSLITKQSDIGAWEGGAVFSFKPPHFVMKEI